MHAMVLNELRTPLKLTELTDSLPGPNEIRVNANACSVCRTDLRGGRFAGAAVLVPHH